MPIAKSKVAQLSVLLCLMCFRASSAQATLIHSFSDQIDGNHPLGGLLRDAHGNLFGVTEGGGPEIYNMPPKYPGGTAFELSPVTGGGWAEKILHAFNYSPQGDGYVPNGALITDQTGNLYGVTEAGGRYNEGTVFELTPGTDGSWAETLLYSFGNSPTDGTGPFGNLVLDAAGNLYGTTAGGGAVENHGTVYKLTPGSGGWTETILHSFGQNVTDGQNPEAGLAVDAEGNLYGTTPHFGLLSGGTVFELVRQQDGSWLEKNLHEFGLVAGDGAAPVATVTLDGNGNLYGTTSEGGTADYGTVFELSPGAGGVWTEKLFSVFTFPGYGALPTGQVTLGPHGELFVTASSAGGAVPYTGDGLAFKLTPQPNGSWNPTLLARFALNQGSGGRTPSGGLVFDSQGDLYGTTFNGGPSNDGTIFRIGPHAGVSATTLMINPSTSLVAGEPITLVATVTGDDGLPVTSGLVTFTDPAFPERSATLPLNNMGQATFAARAPGAGTYSVVASYTNADGFVESRSPTITKVVR